MDISPRANSFPLALVAVSFFLGFLCARGADAGPSVILSSPGPELHGVAEVSRMPGKVQPCRPKLGQTIELLTYDIDRWLDELKADNVIAPATTSENLTDALYSRKLIEEMLPKFRLVLDGQPMSTLPAGATAYAGRYAERWVGDANTSADIDLPALVNALKTPLRPIDRWLKKSIHEPAENAPAKGNSSKPVEADWMKAIDNFLRDGKPVAPQDLNDPAAKGDKDSDDFNIQSVTLRPDTKTLLSKRPQQGDDLVILKRLLLEDAYPRLEKTGYFSIQFQLTRDSDKAESKADWQAILTRPGTSLSMDVTLGLVGNDGRIYGAPTYVVRGAASSSNTFAFRRVPLDSWTVTCVIVLLGSFGLFLYLAFNTAILRDPSQPIRPDGLPPFSLGRWQMAFWFFLVAGSFLFLWVVTGRGDTDTITDSTLVLLGISAATALGAALAPNPNRSVDTNAATPAVNYRADIAAAKQTLRQLDATRKALAGGKGSDESLKSNADAAEKARAALRQSEENLAEYHRTHPNQFLTDLLSEDNKTVTFHRFQILVWTLVLGVVFVSGVLTRLAMPTFSPTLLLLMGISSGTYLGFKFAPSQPGGA
jgi:hypothetical protein